VTGEPLFGVIAALLLLIALWLLWTFLKVYFQAKLVARVERDVNRIGKRLEELSCAPAADYHTGIKGLMPTLNLPDENAIYKDLVQKFSLPNLWARVCTRISIGRKNDSRTSELTVKIVRLTAEIESLIRNDFRSRSLAQLGAWDDEKIAFFRDAGIKERASIAAIDQLVADIEHELRV
jgi:hypothetical protein